MNHNGTPLEDSMSESSTKRVRGGQTRGNRGKPKENRATRGNRRSNENKRETRGENQRREKQSPQIKNNKEFPELGKAENFPKKNERSQRRNDKRGDKDNRNARKGS